MVLSLKNGYGQQQHKGNAEQKGRERVSLSVIQFLHFIVQSDAGDARDAWD